MAAIMVVTLFLSASPALRGLPAGGVLFQILTGYAFGLCAVAGVFVTADCLSEEKRGGTLDLLFLTDLRPHEIVLGKFAARLLNPFLALLAILPVISLALLLGGVTGGEFWRSALALLNTLFFSLAIGIAVSACSRDPQRAAGATLGLLLLLCGLLPLASRFFSNTTAPWLNIANWFGPFSACRGAMDTAFALNPARYWGGLMVSHAVAWCCLLGAALSLRRTWRDEPAVSEVTSASPQRPRRRIQPSRADENPVYALISGGNGLTGITWMIALCWAVAALGGLQWYPRVVTWPVLVLAAKAVGLILKILFVSQVTRFFVEARRSGSLELLLCTPVTDAEILRAHTRHLGRGFLGPVILLLLPILAAMLVAKEFAGVAGSRWSFLGAQTHWTGLWLIPTIITDFLALGTVGLWLALSMKRPALAPGVTALLVLLPPLFLLCIPDIFYNALLIAWARERLGHDFRKRITEQLTREQPAASP